MLENNPPNGAGLNPVSDESWSDPWHDLNLLGDILRLAGVKQLELGRIRLKAAFESWYRLIYAGAGAKESRMVNAAKAFLSALRPEQKAKALLPFKAVFYQVGIGKDF